MNTEKLTIEQIKALADNQIKIKVGVIHLHFESEDALRADADAMRHLPDYPNDLNAMHDVEILMPDELYGKYAKIIEGFYMEKTRGFSSLGAINATARERAEACLMVAQIES